MSFVLPGKEETLSGSEYVVDGSNGTGLKNKHLAYLKGDPEANISS